MRSHSRSSEPQTAGEAQVFTSHHCLMINKLFILWPEIKKKFLLNAAVRLYRFKNPNSRKPPNLIKANCPFFVLYGPEK